MSSEEMDKLLLDALAKVPADEVTLEKKKPGRGRKPKAQGKPVPKAQVEFTPQTADEYELSADEKAALELEARKEILAEEKKRKAKEFKDAFKQQLKKKRLFQEGKDEQGENLESILITMPRFSPEIRIDGRIYRAGCVYRVTEKLAAVFKETMFRNEVHDNELQGKNSSDFYGNRPRGFVLGPNRALPPGVTI